MPASALLTRVVENRGGRLGNAAGRQHERICLAKYDLLQVGPWADLSGKAD